MSAIPYTFVCAWILVSPCKFKLLSHTHTNTQTHTHTHTHIYIYIYIYVYIYISLGYFWLSSSAITNAAVQVHEQLTDYVQFRNLK